MLYGRECYWDGQFTLINSGFFGEPEPYDFIHNNHVYSLNMKFSSQAHGLAVWLPVDELWGGDWVIGTLISLMY
jgi:hypothetical protein